MYCRVYFQVGLVNEFLRQTTDDEARVARRDTATLAAEIKQYRAEARFLRALSYWHGIDLFGDIPLVTEGARSARRRRRRARAPRCSTTSCPS